MKIEFCPICQNISENEQEKFLSSLHLTSRKYKKGESSAKQGDLIHSLYILSKGKVKTEMITESGRILSIETITAPSPLAAAFLFTENNRFPVDITALEICTVIKITKESLIKQLTTNENFLKSYMMFTSKIQFLSEKLRLLSIKPLKENWLIIFNNEVPEKHFKLIEINVNL